MPDTFWFILIRDRQTGAIYGLGTPSATGFRWYKDPAAARAASREHRAVNPIPEREDLLLAETRIVEPIP
jgi:hypothetical protein